ncbi:MAG: nitrite reductase small subunit NirD [Colwellia polaris]|jgi:nitrite reductase (NADH) small subunit|uniref:nitrite reductase small subunit NirD n=1 Tax=Colwellia polaris TaxID=326537 RepID=UPI000A17135A|nr:nitrite reductase small subunit NirD [Colwellia polaris]|tara:strand:- start:9846 stop:10181 length:336 start_codon:yes stop_codon:yes gene_type:complete
MTTEHSWQPICSTSDLIKNSGVCALLANQEQVALFQVGNDKIYAVSNFDPFGKANVLYRGLIGETKGDVYVASPLLKQRFMLSSGVCLDDDAYTIKTYETRITDGELEILG